MEKVSLVKVGGVCAILTSIVAAAAIIMFSAGTDLLDAEDAAEFLPIADQDQALIATGSWLFILANVLVTAAGLAIFQALRRSGALMWIAVVAFVGGGIFLILENLIGFALFHELAPSYVDAEPSTKIALAVLGDTLAEVGDRALSVGDALSFGVGILLFSLAILRTSVAPRWVGWLGLIVAVSGWVGLLPASDALELVMFIGEIAFLVWLIAIGVVLLRAPEPVVATSEPVVATAGA